MTRDDDDEVVPFHLSELLAWHPTEGFLDMGVIELWLEDGGPPVRCHATFHTTSLPAGTRLEDGTVVEGDGWTLPVWELRRVDDE